MMRALHRHTSGEQTEASKIRHGRRCFSNEFSAESTTGWAESPNAYEPLE
jgi:hypothetical protein